MKKSYLAMIRAFPGGWDAMAAALGMSRMSLENRIYERKGQSLLVETAMMMQKLSDTTHFADEVAKESGGIFLPITQFDGIADIELLDAYTQMVADEGQFATDFRMAMRGGITKERFSKLRDDIHEQQRHEMELLARIESLVEDEK